MARARNIKPGFFKNYDLADLGPLCQVLFAGLWCLADREGRLEDKPRLIKAEIFPYYDCDINGELTKLERLGFVRRYAGNGIAVIEVVAFKKHQSPHNTEKASSLPTFEQRDIVSHCFEKEHEINESLTVGSPYHNDGNLPDSLIPDSLIPDSLIPERSLSGKPDDAASKEVLDFLNLKTNSRYRAVASNIEKIAARLKEGATVDEMKQVIGQKAAEWMGTKWEMYLRPDTLFNATKYNQYVGQIGKEFVRQEMLPKSHRGSNMQSRSDDNINGFLNSFGSHPDDPTIIDMEPA